MFGHDLRGGSHGVLVGEDGAARGVAGGPAGVDGRDEGEVVLVFLEVGGCAGESAVEGVEEGGVEGAEGEFVDYVGEIERWWGNTPVLAGKANQIFG